MAQPPKQVKIGRDITVEEYLNSTTDKHNGHGYSDWQAEKAHHIEVDGKINVARLARYMGIAKTDTIYKWLAAEGEKA